MSNVIVIGAQWGDEGKGKLVDILAEKAKVVARFQGGNNAGHTVMFGDKSFILHLIPSGILQDDTTCVIGNGMVVDPGELLKEIDSLQELGVECKGKLFISSSANLIMPYHKLLDKAREERLRNQKIGTTGRGIGPAYEDKVGRIGVRFADIENNSFFKEKLDKIVIDKNLILKHVLGFKGPFPDPNEVFEELLGLYERIQPYLANTTEMLGTAMKNGDHVLFEGAQGTFLDIDHGTYPFVTSSNTVAGGACTGTGVGPTRIDRVAAVVKAYTTRVGSGPFPTELSDETGDLLSKVGKEFGATTGRARRCGWFDSCMLKEAVTINGITDLAITKLDVLDQLETVKICTGYRSGSGKTLTSLPKKQRAQDGLEPIYEELPGWQSSTAGITNYDELPDNAKKYLERIESLLEVPIFVISTGPKREETIVLKDIYQKS